MKTRRILIMFAGLMVTGVVNAANSINTLNVTATVPPACTVTATGGVDFTFQDSTDTYANGSVTVNCANGTAYNLYLDAGQNFNAQTGERNVIDQVTLNTLPYALYSDSNYATEWGDGGTTIFPPGISDTGSGSDQNHVVYGKLFGSQVNSYPLVGTYSDIVTVSVIY